jgi:nucleotidyltransferase/DNA polymerase involved in DNA repair
MYVCVYIPDFSVQAVTRGDPTLRRRAVAIVDGTAPLLRVVALNDPARTAGIGLGMTAVQVAQLGSGAASTKVEVRRRSPAQEAVAHAALLDCAYSVSPRLEDTAADTVLLDLAGLERALGSPEKIAHRLAQQGFGLGLEVHIAVAPNPDAARHAARGFPGITLIAPGEEAERLGCLPVEALTPPQEILESLHRWGARTFHALAALPTGQLSERLGQEGVHLQALARGAALRPLVPAQATLHFEEAMELEYAATEIEPLSFILGRLLNQLCARLAARSLATNELKLQLGLEAHELEVAAVSDTGVRDSGFGFRETGNSKFETRHSEIQNPESEIESSEPRIPNSESRARGATPEIAQSKIQNPKSKITRTSNSESRILRLPVPLRDSKVFLKLLQLNLQADPPPAPILKVRITANPAKPRTVQGGLFLPLSPDPEKLELVLARIAGVVGKENVGWAELLDTHRPDAFRMQRFVTGVRGSEFGIRRIRKWKLETGDRKLETGNSKLIHRKSKFKNQKSEIGTPQPRIPNPQSHAVMALRVFRPPVPARVEVRMKRPARIFSACGVRGEIVSASGPWRTSGDWWTDRAWEHDEWDVAVVSGPWSVVRCTAQRTTSDRRRITLYRLYRDLSSGSWFVQGVYD